MEFTANYFYTGLICGRSAAGVLRGLSQEEMAHVCFALWATSHVRVLHQLAMAKGKSMNGMAWKEDEKREEKPGGKAVAESECAPSTARSVGKVIAPEVIL